ncbi:hypothetical protein ACFWWA_36675 [Streptomyces goshikiensis]|uniref:hypothetical protein n=1 Tax=Streptomyces goshikiensis TaxID=1942 RepID=UPI00365169A3
MILPLRTGDHSNLQGLFEGEGLVAMWKLDPTSPGPGWSVSERQERSICLFRLYTDPVHRNAGRLVSLWLADHVARMPRPPGWLRCSVPDGRLAAHITGAWGWREVRLEDGHHLLQLPPEPKPHLDLLIAGQPAYAVPGGGAHPLALTRSDHS